MSKHYLANHPMRKVTKIIRKSQDSIDLRLECGHTVAHAIPYSSEKSIIALTPTRKRCGECPASKLRGFAASELSL